MAARRRSSWRARACSITAVCAAHNRVEPSTSVKRNVTDPLGCLLGTPPRSQSHTTRRSLVRVLEEIEAAGLIDPSAPDAEYRTVIAQQLLDVGLSVADVIAILEADDVEHDDELTLAVPRTAARDHASSRPGSASRSSRSSRSRSPRASHRAARRRRTRASSRRGTKRCSRRSTPVWRCSVSRRRSTSSE